MAADPRKLVLWRTLSLCAISLSVVMSAITYARQKEKKKQPREPYLDLPYMRCRTKVLVGPICQNCHGKQDLRNLSTVMSRECRPSRAALRLQTANFPLSIFHPRAFNRRWHGDVVGMLNLSNHCRSIAERLRIAHAIYIAFNWGDETRKCLRD